jgi:hypothetical protein
MIDAMLEVAAERGMAFRAFGRLEDFRALRLVCEVLTDLLERRRDGTGR